MALSQLSALVIGTGGLGGPALLALAAGGVGRIVLVDDDAVETSNLNRQPLFGEADLGERKATAAARRLATLHPDARIEPVDGRFVEAIADGLVNSVDVVVDGSDNFPTRFLASDVAVRTGRPLVHGGVLRTSLQILTVVPGQTGCLRCLFEGPPAPGTVITPAEAGIVGGVSGFAGALMGAEALRLLAGERGAYAGRLFAFETRTARGRIVPVRRRAGCPACGAGAGPRTSDGAVAGAGARADAADAADAAGAGGEG